MKGGRRPQLLILDEPFTGLDPLVRDELVEGILGISTEHGWTVFVSSHDLAEIENLVTHVAYLDRGRLQFSEELASLQDRFREIEVTCDGPAIAPAARPEAWLKADTSGAVVRFVVTDYAEDDPAAGTVDVPSLPQPPSVRPMSLRSIFISMAKERRRAQCPEAL